MNDDSLSSIAPFPGAGQTRPSLWFVRSYGLDEAGVREGLERGANYIFWSPAKKFLRTIIKDVVMPNRERYVLTHLAGYHRVIQLGYFPRKAARSANAWPAGQCPLSFRRCDG